MLTAPDKANRALDLTNRGDLELKIPSVADASLLLYEASQQLLFAFMAAVFGAFAYTLSAAGHRVLSIGAWAIAAMCLVVVGRAFVRARAVRRKLARRR